MKLRVRVGTGRSRSEVLEPGEFEKKATDLIVHVCARREQGEANRDVVKLLAEHFKVHKDRVRILAGQTSSKKLIEIIINTPNANE